MKNFHDHVTGWIVVVLMVMFAGKMQAANYYIDQKHASANDQNPGTFDLPWMTISKANQVLIPGDTVFIRAGTYSSYIAPVNSGTSTAPIIYKNYKTEKVTISDTWYGVLLNAKSYIVVQGISFYNLYYFMYIRNRSSHNIIADCSFDQARMTDGKTYSWSGSRIYENSKFNRIQNCQFSKYGYYTNDDIGCVLDIGNENITTDSTSYNLIENCTFFHGGHHVVGVYGMFNVFRNNYFHNEPWSMGTANSDRGAVLYGDRNLSIAGYAVTSGRNLFEGNQIAYSSDPSDNVGASGMSMNTSYNIVRFNRFYHNDLGGLSMTLTSSYLQDILYNKVYNNTFFHNSLNPDSYRFCGIFFAVYDGDHVIKYNAIKNNLTFAHQLAFGTYKANLDSQIFAGNWNGDTQGDPKFVNAGFYIGNPMDKSLPDLHLLPDSPCKDKGTYLTTIISANGTGNSFTVADAGYFIDGWGITGVQGDEIQLFQTAQKARIISINYSTGLLTLDRDVTWVQNQGLSLPYFDDAPDAGAYEIRIYPVGVNETISSNKINLYPNPTEDYITVSLKTLFDSDYDVCIYNNTGILLQSFTKNKSSNNFSVDFSNFPSGLYLLHLYSKNESYYCKIIRK